MNRKNLIKAARGLIPLDLIIKNVNLINVFTCEIYPADIGIYKNRIANVSPTGKSNLTAQKTIDGTGKWASPGFIDSHLHIESTMVTPANYAKAILPFGTTTSVIDPHEIANVMGMDGVKYMIEASEGLPLHVYITIPSSVPAVPKYETAGASFGPAEVAEMLSWPRVIGIAEVMDYMGVINGTDRMSGIVQVGLDANVAIQGHSPLLTGNDLNAYVAAGIPNDHEMIYGNETLEKLRLGVLPFLKSSSLRDSIPDILPPLLDLPLLDCALCTDDIEPADLLVNGHLDRTMRNIMAYGIEPARVIRWATINSARHYNLKDYGAIAPGYIADIVLLSSLEEVTASEVFIDGELICENGKLVVEINEPNTTINVTNTMHISTPLTEETFTIKAPIANGTVKVNTMEMLPSRLTQIKPLDIPVENHQLKLDSISEDLSYLTIIPRHGQSHPPITIVLKDLHMPKATLAMTIAHDSHNLLVAGNNPADMLLAAKELEKCGGGLILVQDGKVLSQVALPLGGLMSNKSVEELAPEITAINQVAESVGLKGPSPVLAITGLALTVIPKVRISDTHGLFESEKQEVIPLFVE